MTPKRKPTRAKRDERTLREGGGSFEPSSAADNLIYWDPPGEPDPIVTGDVIDAACRILNRLRAKGKR